MSPAPISRSVPTSGVSEPCACMPAGLKLFIVICSEGIPVVEMVKLQIEPGELLSMSTSTGVPERIVPSQPPSKHVKSKPGPEFDAFNWIAAYTAGTVTVTDLPADATSVELTCLR